jgi:hypothetical protein
MLSYPRSGNHRSGFGRKGRRLKKLTSVAQTPSAISVGKIMILKNPKTGRTHAHKQVFVSSSAIQIANRPVSGRVVDTTTSSWEEIERLFRAADQGFKDVLVILA